MPSNAPPPTTYDINYMGGVEGDPLTFNILYRSKREYGTCTVALLCTNTLPCPETLQTLGCIPRTPSPEPETAATISREQKIGELRVSHSS